LTENVFLYIFANSNAKAQIPVWGKQNDVIFMGKSARYVCRDANSIKFYFSSAHIKKSKFMFEFSN